MSVGAFFDKIIFIAFGIYIIYLSKTKREKLGKKATWMLYGGIALIICQILLILLKTI
jgi:hypothetical protein